MKVLLCLVTDCNWVNWNRAFSAREPLDLWIRSWADIYEVPHADVSIDELIAKMRDVDVFIDYALADINTGELTTDGMLPLTHTKH